MKEHTKNLQADHAPAENKMGTMPVNKLLISMALPMMISMLVQALYNVVDSIFVSKICEDALTAVSMAFPMQNLLIGVGSGLGVGTNALLSKYLGEQNSKEASNMALHGLFLAGISYVLFLILGITTTRIFFVIQGASDTITQYGHDYLSIILICSFGLFMQMMFERLLQATGRTLYTMFTQGTGAIINLILDPILIFGLFGFPKMGITGAALATVIGQVCAGLFALYFNLKVNKELHFNFKEFRPRAAVVIRILYIGVPSIIMIAIGSIMTFSMNKILGTFSSTAVAVFGVYFKLQSFAFMPIFGMNNGMIPIVAYNYGARKPDRMLDARKYAIIYAEVIMVCALLTFQIIPAPLLSLFSASEHMLAIGVPALRIISVSYIFAAICIISSSFFQALGNGIYSMIVSFTRQLVFLVPCAFLFSKTGNINLVWTAWPIAEIASIALSLYYMKRIKERILNPLLKG